MKKCFYTESKPAKACNNLKYKAQLFELLHGDSLYFNHYPIKISINNMALRNNRSTMMSYYNEFKDYNIYSPNKISNY